MFRTGLLLALLACSALARGAAYDEHLCRSAQRLLVNANDELAVAEQVGAGNGFHTIQMDVDAETGVAVIAMTTDYTSIDGENVATHVSCKMVDRDRINDVLALNLPGPDRQCRRVNEHTYARALAGLTAAERRRYLDDGRKLAFGDDAILASGGEWLPVSMDAFVDVSGGDVIVRAPSVRVPWNSSERNFYQGTQHCKLITLAAMERWLRSGAFDPDATLLPATDLACDAPHAMTSTVCSCRFYFAPADAMFCQDYSGPAWSPDTARAECDQRHASAAALRAAENRYAGAGGRFSTKNCAARDDAPAIVGTCVFHCRRPDETLWHVAGAIDPRMTRGCDLFLRGSEPLPTREGDST
ncbi:MAG: hypothetical protein ACR2QV_02990 [Gammaproteobacteria bacterium]